MIKWVKQLFRREKSLDEIIAMERIERWGEIVKWSQASPHLHWVFNQYVLNKMTLKELVKELKLFEKVKKINDWSKYD